MKTVSYKVLFLLVLASNASAMSQEVKPRSPGGGDDSVALRENELFIMRFIMRHGALKHYDEAGVCRIYTMPLAMGVVCRAAVKTHITHLQKVTLRARETACVAYLSEDDPEDVNGEVAQIFARAGSSDDCLPRPASRGVVTAGEAEEEEESSVEDMNQRLRELSVPICAS